MLVQRSVNIHMSVCKNQRCGGYAEDSCELWDFVLHFTCHCLGKARNLPNGQSQGPRATKGGGGAEIGRGTFSDL